MMVIDVQLDHVTVSGMHHLCFSCTSRVVFINLYNHEGISKEIYVCIIINNKIIIINNDTIINSCPIHNNIIITVL